MKKVFYIVVVLVLLLAGAAYWLMGNLDQIVKDQVETQGSKILDVPVRLEKVTLKLFDGLGELNGFSIANPKGFSDNSLLGFDTVRLDLDTENMTSTHVIVDEILVSRANARYEVNAQGKGNMNVLLDQLKRMKSDSGTSSQASESEAGEAESDLRISVRTITIENTQLALDLSALGQKVYDETLPTFKATAIGGEEGLPPSELGVTIADVMLRNFARQAAKKQEDRLKAKAIDKAKEKLSEEVKDNEKLKGIMDKLGHNF